MLIHKIKYVERDLVSCRVLLNRSYTSIQEIESSTRDSDSLICCVVSAAKLVLCDSIARLGDYRAGEPFPLQHR